MKRLIILLIILAPAVSVFGQKVKKSEGEYLLNLSRSNLSETQACEQCKELARVQAIEKAFGTVIIQGNTTYIRNTQTGKDVRTEQQMNVLAETFVNGDWIETTDESCERIFEKDEFWIRCSVSGKVRELSEPPIRLDVKAMRCDQAGCDGTRFQDGDPLYLAVQAPQSGYISVYLANHETAQRLFPYRGMPDEQINGAKLAADKAYLLFSRKHDPFGLGRLVDEYALYAETEQDLNRLYVVYSKTPLNKPLLKNRRHSLMQLPPELSAAEFQRWLSQARAISKDVAVERLDLEIRK